MGNICRVSMAHIWTSRLLWHKLRPSLKDGTSALQHPHFWEHTSCPDPCSHSHSSGVHGTHRGSCDLSSSSTSSHHSVPSLGGRWQARHRAVPQGLVPQHTHTHTLNIWLLQTILFTGRWRLRCPWSAVPYRTRMFKNLLWPLKGQFMFFSVFPGKSNAHF